MLNDLQREVYKIIKQRYLNNDIVVDNIISNVIENIIKDYSREDCLNIIHNSIYQANIEDYSSQKL